TYDQGDRFLYCEHKLSFRLTDFFDVTAKSETKSIAVFLLRPPLHFFAFGRAAVFEQLAHTPGPLVASAALKAMCASTDIAGVSARSSVICRRSSLFRR